MKIVQDQVDMFIKGLIQTIILPLIMKRGE